MVFTNSIMTTHVNKTIDRPLMSSMAIRRYRSAHVVNLRGGYREPSIVIAQILDHNDGQYVRSNKVAFKYPNFKKDVDLDVHVKVFNSIVKANVKAFEEYIINAFSYMLRDKTSNWCHNYMSKFPNCTFLELRQAFCKCHRKIQNEEQIYMELKNMK